MTNPASKPASSPTRTHVANMTKLMTLPPSSGYGSAASLPPHRCTRGAPSPFAPVGWTRAQAPLAGGRSSRRRVAVLPHQESLEHFDCPLVQGPVVDHHLHGGAREPPDPLGRRGGADDDVDSPNQTTEGGPLGSWAKRWRVSSCALARSATTGTPLPLRSRPTCRRWQKLVTAARQRPACFWRRTVVARSPRSTLSTRIGRWASSCRAKKSSSGGLHSTRRTSTVPWTAAGRTPARLKTPTDKSSAVIPRAAARIAVSSKKLSRR